MNPSAKKAERLLQIEKLLLAHPHGLTQAELARRLQVNRSTIGRYIPDLPKHIYIDDLDGNKWKIDRSAYPIHARFTLHEALALHLATRLLATRMDKQNPHAAAALRTLGDALERIAPKISQHMLQSADVMDTENQQHDPRYLQVLEILTIAWAEKRKVKIWHRYQRTGNVYIYKFSPYFIEPYAVGQTTHVIGHREPPNELRTFKVERIERIEWDDDGEMYEIDESFDPRNLLADAWGIWFTDDLPEEVVLRFHQNVAERVAESRWHGSEQPLEKQPDGSVIWRAKVAQPIEMLPWIRGWGADVTVIAPDDLKESIMADVRRSAEYYTLTPQTKSKIDRLLRLWGKTTADPNMFHPALYHMIDVAHIAYWLLSSHASPRWRNVLAYTLNANAGKLQEWLPYIIALHDIGKISVPFQIQNPAQKVRLVEKGFTFGSYRRQSHAELHHTLVGQLHIRNSPTFDALPDTFHTAFSAMIGGHHGYYQEPESRIRRKWKTLKEPAEWVQLREHATELLQKTFLLVAPTDWVTPTNISAGISTLNGFTILCDWLGSDKGYFQPRPTTSLHDYIPHSRHQAYKRLESADFFHNTLSTAPIPFADLFRFDHPRPLQLAIDYIPQTMLTQPTLTIIEGSTGEGKTEAGKALAHRIGRLRGTNEFYFALPTTATSNKMFERVQKFLHNNLNLDSHLIKLVHGQSYTEADLRLTFDDVQENEDGDHPALAWFTPKKQALLAPFAVGTIDQAEMTALNVKYNALRLMGLAGKVVILDEVHAYDTYMMTIIERMLAWLAQVGTSVILLSATLPTQKRQALAEAYAGISLPPFPAKPTDYPALITLNQTHPPHIALPPAHQPHHTVHLHPLHFGDNATTKAQWLLQQVINGGCACWITNTVKNAQALFQALCEIVPNDVDLTLLHARFPLADRQNRENSINRDYGDEDEDVIRPSKGIVIGTQVLEQSLDLDFDVMVSDLAPIDLLLQRAGRLHRHTTRTNRSAQHPEPHFYVHALLDDKGVLQMGDDKFYGEYILRRTWEQIEARCQANQPLTLPLDYRTLVDAVYNDESPAPDHPLYDAWQQLQNSQTKLEDEAKIRLTATPDPHQPFCDVPNLTFREDEESNDWMVAQTRYQERPSLTVIPLQKIDENTAQLPDGTPINLHQRPDDKLAIRLLNRHIRLSNYQIVPELLATADTRPTLFTQSTLLKHCHPIWLTETNEGITLPIRLDNDLGLVVTEKEEMK